MDETLMTPRRIADDHVERVAAQDPTTSAALGLHPGDDRQSDLSPEGFEALAELDRRALGLLDAAPRSGDPGELNCARLLRERLTASLAVHDAGDHLSQLCPTGSPVHQVRQILTLMPTATDEDWAAVAGRLRNLPGALNGYRASLTEGMSRKLFAAPRQALVVADQLTAWTGEDTGGTDWFTGFVAPAPEHWRGELETAAGRAASAVAGFRDWLREDYLAAAEGTPDAVGRERYQRSARYFTGADLDLDTDYDWAWSEFHRTLGEMRAEADLVVPGATVLEAMSHLDEHGPAIRGEQQVREWLQELMDGAIEALDGVHFDISGQLRRVESRIAPPGTGVAPHYMGPSLDFSRPGRTYLPTLGRETFPTWGLVSTWYHEGVPGHHLQLASWVAAADQLSRYQVTLGKISANVEGWALYAERLMNDLGFLDSPGLRLGYLDKQMLRIIRVIIDIGMHLELAIPADSGFHPGERWTPELAAEFMAAHLGLPAKRQAGELTRYLGRPGQAIGYKLGERAWLRGRESARERRGAGFDLKAWHTRALVQGSFGLDDLVDNLARL